MAPPVIRVIRLAEIFCKSFIELVSHRRRLARSARRTDARRISEDIHMFELIFTACLLAQSDTCREDRLVYTDITPMTCMMGAQAQLAEWVNGDPEWTVARWRCAPVDRIPKKI